MLLRQVEPTTEEPSLKLQLTNYDKLDSFSQLSVDQAQDSLIKYFFTSNEAPFI